MKQKVEFMTALMRYCVAAGNAIALDSNGYLLDPADTFGHAMNPGLIALSELVQYPNVALLGEPGSGKTTAIRYITELLHEHFTDLPIVEVDLLEVTDRAAFHDLVVRPVRAKLPSAADGADGVSRPEPRVADSDDALNVSVASNEVPQASGSSGGQPLLADALLSTGIVLILDGVDQCPVDLRLLSRWLTQLFRGVDHRSLRMLVAARTADWPGVLERDLAAVHRTFNVFELVPLRRADVVAFADSHGLNGDQFLNAVDMAGAGPLAAIPITLQLLVDLYARDLTLPARTADLYRQGLLVLADEPDPDRREAVQRRGPSSITPQQRVAVAGRIAGCLQLCRRAAVWRGPAAQMPRSDIADGDLPGGSEPAAEREILVDADAVSVTLGTAIFTGRGSQRLGVTHQSFASYLAARYLNAHQLPEPQLRSLLLGFSEAGTVAVHPALRETAAWLVSLDPSAHRWLLEVDAETIATYPIITTDPAIRQLLVEQLLRLAENDLLRSAFSIRYGQLSHPYLAQQLQPVLRSGNREQRIMAIRLAAKANADSIVDDLIDLALDSSQPDGLRSMAAAAASTANLEHTATRLLPLAFDPGDDPNDEIRGAALQACWPEQISTEELFAALTPPKRDSLIGGYSLFLGELPGRLRDEDLPTALTWVGDQPDGDPLSNIYAQVQEIRDRIVARVWQSPRRQELIPQMAPVLLRQVATHSADCLEFLGPTETAADESDRRLLVDALLAVNTSDENVWQIAHPSSAAGGRLVKATDLAWLLEREANADENTARQLHILIRAAFLPGDPNHTELAWQYRDTRVWAELRPWFDAIPLDSHQAREQRRIHELASQSSRRRQDPARRAAHLGELTNLIRKAASGEDPEAFWRACWLMQVDPDSGGGHMWWSDDLTDRPSYRALTQEERALLLVAADRYLKDTGPHDEEWLENPTILDKRPVAGYLALALLDREAPHLIDQLDYRVWQRWAPAVVWYDATAVNAGDSERKRRLLAQLCSRAPDATTSAYLRYLRAYSRAGRRAYELDFADSCWTSTLADALASELPALEAHDQENYEVVLRLLIRQAQPATIAYARRVLLSQPEEEDDQPARRVALMLLAADPGLYWDLVFQTMRDHPAWGRELTMDLSRNWDNPQLLPALSETDLAELYRWLTTQFPYESDVWVEGAHFVGTREQVQSWREQVLDHLVNRGTPAAVRAVAAFAKALPHLPWLKRRLLDAEEQQRLTWTPPTPAELLLLVGNPSRRYLQHGADLLDVLADELAWIERDSLHGLTPVARLLWNETRDGTQTAWRPKLEADLSDFLADQLRLRIAGRDIIVNREVEIRRLNSLGVGERVDLLIQALSSAPETPAENMAVVIEVKGNWNDDLLTAMRPQLADDYLPTVGTSYGIYLVGWFPPHQWDERDQRRRAKASRFTAEQVKQELAQQAEQLRADSGLSVQPILLDLSRPENPSEASTP